MRQYIVIIDNVPTGNMAATVSKIKSFGSWARISDTVWYISTSHELAAVRNAVYPEGGEQCRVFVVDVTSQPWASFNLPREVAEWLKKL